MALRRPRVKPTANLSIKRPVSNNRPAILRAPAAAAPVKVEQDDPPASVDPPKPIKVENNVLPKQETTKTTPIIVPPQTPPPPAPSPTPPPTLNTFIPPRPSPSPSPVHSPAPLPYRSPAYNLSSRSPAHAHLDDALFKSPIMSPSYPPPPSRTPNPHIAMKVMSPVDLTRGTLENPNSPSKARHRIRATPVLAHRRNSGQVNEDDELPQRMPQRVRHISTSSTASIPKFVPQQVGRIRTESSCSAYSDVSVFKPRRTGRSDEYMRLCEARRELLQKYNGETPDKSQLRMYDMIYYNPKTNPMKRREEAGSVNGDGKERRLSVSSTVSAMKEEKTVAKEKETAKEAEKKVELETENAMPVPQLKLGPNGEMILDEKSLTIETTGEKEARELLANADIVYDDANTSSGFYKRQKRTRDWSPEETLRFYRCLQAIGTDFSLMLDLFPNRSRRDLKLKFKKEERTNEFLVNKALIDYTSFDVDQLKATLMAEDEQREQEKREAEERKNKAVESRAELIKKLKQKRGKSLSTCERAVDDLDIDLESPMIELRKSKPRKFKGKVKQQILPSAESQSPVSVPPASPSKTPHWPGMSSPQMPMPRSPQKLNNSGVYYYDMDLNRATPGERRVSVSLADNVQIINPKSVEMIHEVEGQIMPPPIAIKVEKKETEKPPTKVTEPEQVQKNVEADDEDEDVDVEFIEEDEDPMDGLDLSNLVVLEVKHPETGAKSYKVHLMDKETEDMSEEPLDLPQDVIDYIVETHQKKRLVSGGDQQ